MTGPRRIALALGDATMPSGRSFFIGAYTYAHTRPDWEVVRVGDSAMLDWRAALAAKPDGILGILNPDTPLPRRVSRIPVVILNAAVSRHPYHRVCSDSREAGRRAGVHLIERRLPHFASVEARGAYFSRLRTAGLRDALRAAGRGPRLAVADNHTLQYEPALFRRWLLSLPLPCGILVAQDHIGIQVVRQCQAAGLDVPRDVAVVSISNDVMMCVEAPVPLSSVSQDFEAVGQRGAARLEALLAGQRGLPRTEWVPPGEVVARESTLASGVSDPLVRRAHEIIQQRYHERLSVAELLARLGKVSRRQLESRFRAETGTSPHQEILQCRVRQAQRLLRSTRLTTEEIAQQCGFYDATHLCRHFKSEIGLTPLRYRKQTA